MIYLGVDCGALGAVAALNGADGRLIMVEDMPADKIMIAGKERHRVSPHRLAELFRPFGGQQGDVRMIAEIPTYRPMVSRNKTTGMTETRSAGAAGLAAEFPAWLRPGQSPAYRAISQCVALYKNPRCAAAARLV